VALLLVPPLHFLNLLFFSSQCYFNKESSQKVQQTKNKYEHADSKKETHGRQKMTHIMKLFEFDDFL